MAKATNAATTTSKQFANSYYGVLGVHPSASPIEIRRAYRELSKRYHPDTTDLPQEVAKAKFQTLNEAYATLSNPQRRALYDYQIGYSRLNVMQPSLAFQAQEKRNNFYNGVRKSYLEYSERPLSSGEIFALLILGVTFLICIVLIIVVGLTRGEAAFRVPEVAETSMFLKPFLHLLVKL